jgi:peptide/nickel transport system substrate-binding protein
MKNFLKICSILFTALAFLSCLLLMSPGPLQAAEKPQRGGRLTVATDSTAVGLDPHLVLAFASYTFFEHVYETLIRYNQNMELEPCLATSWEQPDDLTYIFHLRKGVKFHDGSDFTAEDVKFTFERLLDPKTKAPRGVFFKSISRIEAPDKYTIKIVMSQPYPPFLNTIGTAWYGAIVSKAAVEKHGSLQANPIGTGPFKLIKYEHGVKGVYERFEDYWDKGKPYIDGFDFIVIKDETSRVAALRKGTVDIGWIKEAQLADLLAKEKNLKILIGPPVRQNRFWMKADRPPFDNVKARQAVASALDRQEIIDTVLMGRGTLSTALPPGCVPYALSQSEMAKLPFYKQDLALSKKLLKEAGYPDGFEFTCITSPHSPDYIPCAEIMQRQLVKVGIKMNIVQKDWGITLKTYRSGDFISIMFAGIWYPDPEGYSYNYFYSKASGNYFGFKDEKLDRLFEAQHTEANLEKRIKLWHELQRYQAEIVPCIWPYAMTPRFEIVNKRVKGYHFLSNNSRSFLREAWIGE